MDFLSFLEKYDWFSGSWVIQTALDRWAILTVDPSGNVVPERWSRRMNLIERIRFPMVKYQSPGQASAWNALTSDFYHRIMMRAKEYETTFSLQNITIIRQYLEDMPGYNTLMQTTIIPNNKMVAKIQKHYDNAQRDGLRIAEYMLHLDRANALTFLENLSIHWAASLPVVAGSDVPLEHGRFLFLLAEQMEVGKQ